MVPSFFFCKQKTAYEMRISDWSSDVCSSDLSDVPASSDLAHVANAVLVHAVLAGAPGAGDHVSLSLGLEPGDGQGGDLLTRVLTHALFNADHHGLDPRGAVLGDVVSDVHHLQVDLYAGDEIGRAHV